MSLLSLREPIPRALRPWMGLAAPALVGLTWCGLSYSGLAPESFLPTPTDVIKGLLQLWFERGLGSAIWTSFARISLAFVIAAAVAFPLGVAMGSLSIVDRFFDPILAPLRFMPISAFIPLLIVWFGIDETQKIAFLFLGVFVYLLPVVVDAIKRVPQEYVDTAYTLGASRPRVVWTILIPAALPSIFDSFRVMNAIAWTYVILAEAVNPGTSLGYLIQLAYTHAKPSWSFAGLIVIGGVGLLTDFVLHGLTVLIFKWRQ